jgi:hypothetical protein
MAKQLVATSAKTAKAFRNHKYAHDNFGEFS